MDNKNLKKMDGKFIALGQKHERDYLKKVSKDLVEILEEDIINTKEVTGSVMRYAALMKKKDKDDEYYTKYISTAQIIRCLKALLKLIKRYENENQTKNIRLLE